jgi:ribonuclease P protein component
MAGEVRVCGNDSSPRSMEFSREQADLSAEQPPSRQDARLPTADAHACRSRDHLGSAAQGSQRAVGLIPLLSGRGVLVLPSDNRMRSSADFSKVVRDGARVRRGSVVIHQLAGGPVTAAPLIGLVVGRGIGQSVVRHRVSRRLRAQLALRLGRLPAASATVVRALPAASTATSTQLGHDLDAAFDRLGLPVRSPS